VVSSPCLNNVSPKHRQHFHNLGFVRAQFQKFFASEAKPDSSDEKQKSGENVGSDEELGELNPAKTRQIANLVAEYFRIRLE
jgi:hypothetical protein